jgi:hypothetical protein
MKRRIVILTIVSIIVIVVIYSAYKQYQNATVCQFCQKEKAQWKRIPNLEKIEQFKKLDLEPSHAELQTVLTCNECKASAGGFRTTKWLRLY